MKNRLTIERVENGFTVTDTEHPSQTGKVWVANEEGELAALIEKLVSESDD